MRKIVLLILLAILPLCASADLEYCSPESQGLSSEHLSAYFNAMMSTKDCEVHHIVVLRHGKIIGEISPKPFQSNDQHTLYSASKTFVSTAVGLAIAEGKLNLTDRVIDFFPNSLPDSISNELRTMNVRHLLTMTSGIKPDWVMRNKNRDWVACFLKKEVKTPGMEFQYDSMVTYLLAGIVQKVTGKKLIEYLNQKLFAPMEIQDAEWEESPEGINTGGWGLRISTISMAKFGQLLL
ncbi:MAG: beta-lactamase family protein, partial [Paludibacteraceae bacterium]|nr:beta-lactamase family protein [Paludibacteraceae bacterium]